MKRFWKRIVTLLMCASMVITSVDVGATEGGGVEGQITPAAETEATNLLKNGTFADVVDGISSPYGEADGKAAGWSYYTDKRGMADSVLTEEGLEISCVSNVAERLLLN